MIKDNVQQCMLGLFSAFAKRNGAKIDEKALFNELSDPNAKAAYANAKGLYEEDLAKNWQPKDPGTQNGLNWFEKIGIPVNAIKSFIQNPDAVLPKQMVNEVTQVYLDHLKARQALIDQKAAIGEKLTQEEARNLWNQRGADGLSSRGKIGQIYTKWISKIDPGAQSYADDYLLKHSDGASLGYSYEPGSDPFQQLARNVISKFIGWNPTLVAYHAMEFMPKAVAYAIEKDGVAGLPKILDAINKTFSVTKGNWMQKIPELEHQGIYGTSLDEGPTFLGIHSLVDVSERLIRPLSYYLGESLNNGNPMEAVEKIAFVHQLGNEPLSAVSKSGFYTVGLMRYTISAAKMWSSLAIKAVQGNPQAAMALAGFSAMTSLQTGASSWIPAPVRAVMPQEFKDKIDALDDMLPTNMIKKATGSDLGEKAAPFSMVDLGVPLEMVNETGKSTLSSFKHAADYGWQQQYPEMTANIVKGIIGAGQLTRIPGLNITTERLANSITKAVDADINMDLPSIGTEFAQEMHLKQRD